MESLFEKVASVEPIIAEEVLKVADETVAEISDEDIMQDFFEDLEAAGYDLNDEAVMDEVEKFLADNVDAPREQAVEKVAEAIMEDIKQAFEKSAAQGGKLTTGFETAQASKAVDNIFNLHGVANFGSAFGNAPVHTGSAISPSDDSNIFGGWGRLIGQNGVYSRAVNAQSKVSKTLNGSYTDNIKAASAEDLTDEQIALLSLDESIKVAADTENQSYDAYAYDLGFEGIREEVKDELMKDPEMAKVINFDKEASEKTIYRYSGKTGTSLTDTKINEKVADQLIDEATFNWINETAKERSQEPDELVREIGIFKAADYLDELNAYLTELAADGKTINENGEIVELESEKTAGLGDMLKKYTNKGKDVVKKGAKKATKFVKKHKGAVAGAAAGAAAGGGALAAYLAKKKGQDKEASELTGEELIARAREILKINN